MDVSNRVDICPIGSALALAVMLPTDHQTSENSEFWTLLSQDDLAMVEHKLLDKDKILK